RDDDECSKLHSHRLQPPAAYRTMMDASARGGSTIPAWDQQRPLILLAAIPIIKAVTRGNLASDIDGHRFAFPVLHQWLLAKTSVHELLDELIAAKLEKLHIRLHAAIERHGDPPRPSKDLGIFDGHFVLNDVGRHQREALDQVQCVAMEIAGAIEPTPVVEIGHVHDESVSLPVSNGVA